MDFPQIPFSRSGCTLCSAHESLTMLSVQNSLPCRLGSLSLSHSLRPQSPAGDLPSICLLTVHADWECHRERPQSNLRAATALIVRARLPKRPREPQRTYLCVQSVSTVRAHRSSQLSPSLSPIAISPVHARPRAWSGSPSRRGPSTAAAHPLLAPCGARARRAWVEAPRPGARAAPPLCHPGPTVPVFAGHLPQKVATNPAPVWAALRRLRLLLPPGAAHAARDAACSQGTPSASAIAARNVAVHFALCPTCVLCLAVHLVASLHLSSRLLLIIFWLPRASYTLWSDQPTPAQAWHGTFLPALRSFGGAKALFANTNSVTCSSRPMSDVSAIALGTRLLTAARLSDASRLPEKRTTCRWTAWCRKLAKRSARRRSVEFSRSGAGSKALFRYETRS